MMFDVDDAIVMDVCYVCTRGMGGAMIMLDITDRRNRVIK